MAKRLPRSCPKFGKEWPYTQLKQPLAAKAMACLYMVVSRTLPGSSSQSDRRFGDSPAAWKRIWKEAGEFSKLLLCLHIVDGNYSLSAYVIRPGHPSLLKARHISNYLRLTGRTCTGRKIGNHRSSIRLRASLCRRSRRIAFPPTRKD